MAVRVIDWAATGAMLQGIGTILGAVAVIGAARVGASTFEKWRQQRLAEYKREQAERILNAAYQARNSLEQVRMGPLPEHYEKARKILEANKSSGFQHEEKYRKKLLHEKTAYLERFQQAERVRKNLLGCIPVADALFPDREGRSIAQSIQKLNFQFHIIENAAHDLDIFPGDHDYTVGKRFFMYDLPERRDEVKEAVEEAIRTITDFCTPAMRLEKDNEHR